jgi:hypothetical protein
MNLANKSKKSIKSYFKLFYKLEKDLWDNHSNKIKDDIQGFSQLINDFKEHGYDAHQIIPEYLKSFSLKLNIKAYEADISYLAQQRASLNSFKFLIRITLLTFS